MAFASRTIDLPYGTLSVERRTHSIVRCSGKVNATVRVETHIDRPARRIDREVLHFGDTVTVAPLRATGTVLAIFDRLAATLELVESTAVDLSAQEPGFAGTYSRNVEVALVPAPDLDPVLSLTAAAAAPPELLVLCSPEAGTT